MSGVGSIVDEGRGEEIELAAELESEIRVKERFFSSSSILSLVVVELVIEDIGLEEEDKIEEDRPISKTDRALLSGRPKAPKSLLELEIVLE